MVPSSLTVKGFLRKHDILCSLKRVLRLKGEGRRDCEAINEAESSMYVDLSVNADRSDRSPGAVCVEQPGLEGTTPSLSIVTEEEVQARTFYSLTANYAKIGRRR